MATITKPAVFKKLVGSLVSVPHVVRSLYYSLVEILDTKDPKTSDQIKQLMNDQGFNEVVEYVDMALEEGIKAGFFKRATSGEITVYCLNKKRRKSNAGHEKKTGFTRPNYGIGRAVVEVLNEKYTKVFTITSILGHVEDEYPHATVRTVEAVVKHIMRKHPHQIKFDNNFYQKKGVVTYP